MPLVIVHMKALITNQFVQSTYLFLHIFLTSQPTSLKRFSIFLFFNVQLQDFYHNRRARDSKKWPPAENNRQPTRRAESFRAPGTPRSWQLIQTAPAFSRQSRQGTVGATAGG